MDNAPILKLIFCSRRIIITEVYGTILWFVVRTVSGEETKITRS